MEEIRKHAQEHFFAAMLKGWAAGVKGVDVPGMLGYKESPPYVCGYYQVNDRYCISLMGKSAGTTTICLNGKPIWFMSYGGQYLKEDIPFLKRALMYSYKDRHFSGGRGPMLFRGEELEPHYVNRVDSSSSFKNFRGREEINDSRVARGHHDYWGMSLI